MSVYKDKRAGRIQWRYRKVVKLPSGAKARISGTPEINTKAAAQEAERAHIERSIAADIRGVPVAAAPTLREFWPRFIRGYAEAEDNKASEIETKESIYRNRLEPLLGDMRLSAIGGKEIIAIKTEHSSKGLTGATINNTLSVLSRVLVHAEDLGLIVGVPKIKRVKVRKPDVDFLTTDELKRLIAGAGPEPEVLAMVLCGADAGLRDGEIRALRWEDIDTERRRVNVQRRDYRGELDVPKGGAARSVPITRRLVAALKAHRSSVSPWVFYNAATGGRYTANHVVARLRRACRRGDLRRVRAHLLRHTFCTHLAMKGVPARTIMELAGHTDLRTTMRYMHHAPGHADKAIGVLEESPLEANGT